MFTYVTVVCVLGVATAAPYGSYGHSTVGSVSIPRYEFNYAVHDPHTGDHKAQSEMREGGVVKGQYSLAEPDGTWRVVDYTADPVSGFNAVVKRIGDAAHPHTQQIVTPISKSIATPISAPWIAHNMHTSIDLGGHGGFGGLGGIESYWGHGFGHGGLGGHGGWESLASHGGWEGLGGLDAHGSMESLGAHGGIGDLGLGSFGDFSGHDAHGSWLH